MVYHVSVKFKGGLMSYIGEQNACEIILLISINLIHKHQVYALSSVFALISSECTAVMHEFVLQYHFAAKATIWLSP